MSSIEKIFPAAALQIAKLQERERYERDLIEFSEYIWPVVEPAIPFVRGWVLEAIADHLQAVADGNIRRLLINVPPGFTKPVRKDTIVQTLRGELPISDVIVGDMILTHRGRFRRVSAVHDQGVLDVLRVDTWCGRQVWAAPDHPFLTPRGWVRAVDLDDRDVLAAVTPTESFGSFVEPKEARFLGYLIGDGSVKYGGITFTNMEPDVLEDFEDCANYLGFVTRRRPPKVGRATVVAVSSNRNGKLQEFLRKHDLAGKDSYTKRIPPLIAGADCTAVANFLGAYWSCDGYVAIRHTGGKKAYLAKLTTVGKLLAHDTQKLALRIGINLRVRRRVAKLMSKRQGQSYTSYDLEATTQNEVTKIAQLPGLCARKRTAIKEARARFFNDYLLPDPVLSVVPDGRAECRCLSVEDDCSFVANGIAVHNSLMTDVFFPAWLWGPRNQPHMRFLCAAYSEHLTVRDNMRCRSIIISDRYQKLWKNRFRVSTDQFTKIKFANDRTGWKLATSVGGIGTGERADIVIVDDPNNPMEMESEAVRETTKMWFTEVLPDRLNNQQKSAIIVIQQRTHEDDVSGIAISREMGYTHLMVPMHHDPARHCVTVLGHDSQGNEVLWEDPRTEDGELAWKERFPASVCKELERDKGPYAWNG